MSAPEVVYRDDAVTLWHGDASATLATLPAGSVDCIVTSPPYFGLRDYGVDGQMGAESSPAEYVAGMVALFREARRVLADDGTLWLNLGDSYASDLGAGRGSGSMLQGRKHDASQMPTATTNARKPGVTLPRKNLIGIPWRVAFALQDDGWILRNDIIWAKPNAMPESVTDRLSTKHEHVFLLAKSRRYWFDLDPIREHHDFPGKSRTLGPGKASKATGRSAEELAMQVDGHPLGKNPGDVWSIPTQPFPGAHFAVFPPTLPERCILAGCKPGGVVLDPFSGSGTTGLAATKHGRRYVGIDLNADYLELSLRTRLAQGVLA